MAPAHWPLIKQDAVNDRHKTQHHSPLRDGSWACVDSWGTSAERSQPREGGRAMSDTHQDMSPLVNMAHPQISGPVRSSHPVYVDLLPPCNKACPAGEDIQALARLGAGRQISRSVGASGAGQPDAGGAWPGLLSSVRERLQSRRTRRSGQHPCRRTLPGRSGGQRRAGRFRTMTPPSGKRVLVVGAGPSGLSAAYHLARMGHTVEIHEAGPVAGRHDAFRHSGLPTSSR